MLKIVNNYLTIWVLISYDEDMIGNMSTVTTLHLCNYIALKSSIIIFKSNISYSPYCGYIILKVAKSQLK
jgi:hypothetical protein